MIFNTNTWRRINYTVLSPVYDRIARPLEPQRKRSIALVDIQPAERVLIVGAGTGLDLKHIPKSAVVTAIDLTPGMIERLSERAHALGLAVNALVMDAHHLQFPDDSFDVVLLHLILAIIPDPSQCACEAARVLRPGGRVAIFDKFVHDEGGIPLVLRLINPLASILGTNVTRRLGPILANTGLAIEHFETVGLGGLLRIAIARKHIKE